jgi:hypothetical protein
MLNGFVAAKFNIVKFERIMFMQRKQKKSNDHAA